MPPLVLSNFYSHYPRQNKEFVPFINKLGPNNILVAICVLHGECCCHCLENLKYSQCPSEFTTAFWGASAHCLGSTGLKVSWYFAFLKKNNVSHFTFIVLL